MRGKRDSTRLTTVLRVQTSSENPKAFSNLKGMSCTSDIKPPKAKRGRPKKEKPTTEEPIPDEPTEEGARAKDIMAMSLRMSPKAALDLKARYELPNWSLGALQVLDSKSLAKLWAEAKAIELEM